MTQKWQQGWPSYTMECPPPVWSGFKQRVSSGISKFEFVWQKVQEKFEAKRNLVHDSMRPRGPRGGIWIWSPRKEWTELGGIRVWVLTRWFRAIAVMGLALKVYWALKTTVVILTCAQGQHARKKKKKKKNTWLIFLLKEYFFWSVSLNVKHYIPSQNAGLTTHWSAFIVETTPLYLPATGPEAGRKQRVRDGEVCLATPLSFFISLRPYKIVYLCLKSTGLASWNCGDKELTLILFHLTRTR